MSERVAAALDSLVEQHRIPGWAAAVRRHGETWVGAGGVRDLATREPVTPETAFRLASLTKPIGAVLALQALDRREVELDLPIEQWVPELSDVRVWAGGDHPLEETVPAVRPITVRHLLTMTSGWGMADGTDPVDRALFASVVSPGPSAPRTDEAGYLSALANLPPAFQPGEGWRYHTSSDVLGIVLSRATGTDLATLLRERLTEPLGTSSVGFWAVPGQAYATAYVPDDEQGWAVLDPEGFGDPPAFHSLGAGLASTAVDSLVLLDELRAPRTVPPELAAAATSRQLDDRQQASAASTLAPGETYGFQVSVVERPRPRRGAAGAFGWAGGTGTVAVCDPASETTAVLLTNAGLHATDEPPAFAAFLDTVFAD